MCRPLPKCLQATWYATAKTWLQRHEIEHVFDIFFLGGGQRWLSWGIAVFLRPFRASGFCVHQGVPEFGKWNWQRHVPSGDQALPRAALRLGSNVPWLCECAPKACATWVNASVRECPQICGIRSIYRINVLCHETETLSTRPSCRSRRRHRKEGAKSILLSARLCELSWHPSVSERSADSVFFSWTSVLVLVSVCFLWLFFSLFSQVLGFRSLAPSFHKASFPWRLTSYWTKILQRIRNAWQVSGRRILQRIRNAWQVTGRRSYNVSGTPDKLLDEDLTTYQERLTSFWTKILQGSRNPWQVTGRRSYNVSGTPDKLLDEDLTTYQERLTSFWTKILQRIRNAWQVTGRRCSDENVTTYQDIVIDTAGHRTLLHLPHPPQNLPPKTSSWKMIKYWFGFPPVG